MSLNTWADNHTERAEMHAADGNQHAKKVIALGGEDKWARDEHGRFTSK